MLTQLAQFQNVQQNAQMGVTGMHQMGNLNTGLRSQTQFNDTPDGQFSTVSNTNNLGMMQIQGNHQYGNYVNNGQTTAMARKYNAKGQQVGLMEMDEEPEVENLEEQEPEVENLEEQEPEVENLEEQEPEVENLEEQEPEVENLEEQEPELEELAQFNAYNNNKGGMTQVEGTHAFKQTNNAAGGNFIVKDNKQGQFATFGTTNNAGNMQVSGNHQFDNTTNSGQMTVAPRTFDAKGRPVKLMDLASFNNFQNKAGGMAQFTGTHQVKNLNNAVKGMVIFNDDKLGRFSTVGNTNNAGQMTVSGLHRFENAINSGQFQVIPRKFDAKGRPVKLMDLLM